MKFLLLTVTVIVSITSRAAGEELAIGPIPVLVTIEAKWLNAGKATTCECTLRLLTDRCAFISCEAEGARRAFSRRVDASTQEITLIESLDSAKRKDGKGRWGTTGDKYFAHKVVPAWSNNGMAGLKALDGSVQFTDPRVNQYVQFRVAQLFMRIDDAIVRGDATAVAHLRELLDEYRRAFVAQHVDWQFPDFNSYIVRQKENYNEYTTALAELKEITMENTSELAKLQKARTFEQSINVGIGALSGLGGLKGWAPADEALRGVSGALRDFKDTESTYQKMASYLAARGDELSAQAQAKAESAIGRMKTNHRTARKLLMEKFNTGQLPWQYGRESEWLTLKMMERTGAASDAVSRQKDRQGSYAVPLVEVAIAKGREPLSLTMGAAMKTQVAKGYYDLADELLAQAAFIPAGSAFDPDRCELVEAMARLTYLGIVCEHGLSNWSHCGHPRAVLAGEALKRTMNRYGKRFDHGGDGRALLAYLSLLRGEIPESRSAALEVVESMRDRRNGEFFYNLARIHGALGDGKAAKENLVEAIRYGYDEFQLAKTDADLESINLRELTNLLRIQFEARVVVNATTVDLVVRNTSEIPVSGVHFNLHYLQKQGRYNVLLTDKGYRKECPYRIEVGEILIFQDVAVKFVSADKLVVRCKQSPGISEFKLR